MIDKNAMMTSIPDKIITMVVENAAAIKRENGLAPEALVFTKKGGQGGNGDNGFKASKGGRSPKRDKRDDMRDNKEDRKEKDLRKWFHCQQRGHITENFLTKQRGNPPKASNTAAKASTQTTFTLTTSVENYWMVASSSSLSTDWFINCRCTTHISSCWSMFIT